jgi:hypothetical protein
LHTVHGYARLRPNTASGIARGCPVKCRGASGMRTASVRSARSGRDHTPIVIRNSLRNVLKPYKAFGYRTVWNDRSQAGQAGLDGARPACAGHE